MLNYTSNDNQKEQLPQGITTLKPHLFNFEMSKQSKFSDKINKVRYKNSLPSTFASLKQQTTWKPKIPCKRILGQPKFLISLERKKMRVINGLQQSEFEVPQINRNQFKGERIKTRRQSTSRNNRLSQPFIVSQNYTHNSLNLNITQNHRMTKTPFLNFNLHHLIKQRKNISSQCEPRKQNKKGSNLPYFALFKTERFEKVQKNHHDFLQIQIPNRNIRTQMKTAKTKMEEVNKSAMQQLKDMQPIIHL